MINTYTVPQNIYIHTVSGTIVKNYQDSFILRFHMKSATAEKLLSKEPYLTHHGKDKPAVVLQVMLCAEQELLAEVMWKEDFDKVIYPPKAESEAEGNG
jgi:hypothetical protein